MKKIQRYKNFLFFFFVLSFSLLFVTRVQAAPLTLTPHLAHEGLNFSEPLTFSPADRTGLSSLTISFDRSSPLTISTPSKLHVLAETLVTPQPNKTLAQTNTSRPTSTPTKQPKPTTVFITPTKTPTPYPTATPTPTSAPQATTFPLSTPGGLDGEKLFTMANSYRAERGLPAFQKDERSCQLASSRAPEIASEITSGAMHSGLKARNLPYWNTENIISMRTEEEAFNWWINDYIHRIAIEGNFTYSCVACSGNSCAQEFTNFQSK